MTRYGLTLKMDCDNSDFDEDRSATIARILRQTADKIERGGGDHCALINNRENTAGRLFDANGNTCGTWKARRVRIVQ